MNRWTLLVTLVIPVVAACNDKDPSGPTTTATAPTQAGDGTNGEVTTTSPDTGDGSASATVTPEPTTASSATTGANLPGTDTSASGTSTSSASDPTLPDPSAGPDPTETAFIVPMTDEGGEQGTNPTNASDPSAGGEYGQCGWSDQNQYYDCAYNGATPSLEDPGGIDPIACPAGLMADAPCSEQDGPVGNVGCCDPGGTLYYCTSQGNVIVQEDCGA